jgi:hypothetical protein
VAFLRQCLQQLRAAYPPEPERVIAVPYDGYSDAGSFAFLVSSRGESRRRRHCGSSGRRRDPHISFHSK